GHGRRRGLPRLRRVPLHHRRRAARRRRHGHVSQSERTTSMSKPVIVYGASGYTGRLVCEYLREYNVPFIAAGRDKARIAEAMDKVPGIDTIEHDIVEVSHDVEPLSELFDGAKVVLNTVGPFAQYGREVVEACINTGCHYLDTTGEQDWLIVCDEEYSQRMAEKNLLLAPGIAQMYTTSEIAAQLCLEKPGVDTLDVLVFWKGTPTVASPGPSWSTRACPRRTTWSRTSTRNGPPTPACTTWRSRGNMRSAWPCRGAACRIRCGSSTTRGWPTSRRWAACSTARSCSACRRSSRACWRRSRACRTARSSG